jgi:hypothetical protein
VKIIHDLTYDRDPLADAEADPVEIAAHACHTAWHREDRWNETFTDGRPRVPEVIKAQWRAEARAVIAALARAGFMRA